MNTDYEGVIQTTIDKLEERIKLVVKLMDNSIPMPKSAF
jgi:hypothetical protein